MLESAIQDMKRSLAEREETIIELNEQDELMRRALDSRDDTIESLKVQL